MERNGRTWAVLTGLTIAALCPLAWGKYGGGSGTAADPYLIYTAEQMDAIGTQKSDWSKCFKLMADIDLGGYKGTQFHVIGIDWKGAFSGVFDGNGKTISHFTYTGADVDCIGLFGVVSDNARVENLGLIDPNVTGVRCRYVGSLAGNLGGSATNCYVTNARISGIRHVGGLVGFARSLLNCYATGTVMGGDIVGGLAGDVREAATCCWAEASVVGVNNVGGLAGSAGGGRLGGCFSAGSVQGQNCVGGLVGANGRVVSNCYSICDVNGYDQVGGLVGGGSWASVTAWCYSLGKVTGQSRVGGLIGLDSARMVGIPDAIRACFWDTETSGLATSDGGTGLPTAQMQTLATYLDAGWDFMGETANGVNDLWQMSRKGGYPKLRWELLPPEEVNDVEPGPPWLVDDFADGQASPNWVVYEPPYSVVRVQEIDGKLQLLAAGPPEESIALYVSDGWRLDVTKDFQVKVDFHFSRYSVGDAKVLMGLTPDSVEALSRWIAMEAGCFNRKPFYRAEIRDGAAMQTWPCERSSNDGILYVSYDSLADELYLSSTDYGKANAMQTMAGVLKGRWHTESVRIILGGNSTNMVLREGEAWLDNFAIDSGVLIR